MGITPFPHGISSFGMPVLGSGGVLTTGNIFFVDSDTTYGSNSNSGETPTDAFATLAYAISKCTASNGDIIFVKEGHAETITTQIAANIAGVTVIGLGESDKRPTFTVSSSVRMLYVTGTDCKFYNIKFTTAAGTTAVGVGCLIMIAANNTLFENCFFQAAGVHTSQAYHLLRINSGTDVIFRNCVSRIAITTRTASTTPRVSTVYYCRGGNIIFEGCRHRDFPDTTALAVAAKISVIYCGGALTSSVLVKDCTFNTRGLAVKTRSAGVSQVVTVVGVRAYGTSSTHGAGQATLIPATYLAWLDTICITQVNKRPTTYPAATES